MEAKKKLASADAKMNAFNAEIGSAVRIYRWYPMQGSQRRHARILPSPVV
jgi:hypothetical protein